MIGTVVGDYRVLKQLGEGGMGMVYLGEHQLLHHKVAIKALHPSLFNNDSARDRFVREAEVLARLNHPHIIRLLNFYNLPQGCFIVMEYAEGETLEEKLQKTGLVPPAQVVPGFIQVLRALAYAHSLGVIHRDLKPSNIMLTSQGVAKLLDFGTAKLADAPKLTQQGMTLGTIIYMSKEQLLGKPLDARSDVYSLGVTLYETTTGQLPFYDEEEKKLVLKIAKQDPIPPSEHYPPMPKELERIILKALAKEPDQRWSSAGEMADMLERFQGVSAPAPAPRPATPPAPTPVAPQPKASPPKAAPPKPAPAKKVAPADAGAPANPILHPLVLAGIFLILVSMGLGVGLLVLLPQKLPGIVIVCGGLPLGFILAVAGFLMATRKSAPPKPKRVCPKCGRALLENMAECPFCKPAAPAPAAAAQLTQPQQGGWAGETMNQSFHPAAPPPMPGGPTPAPGTGMLFIVDGQDKGKQFPLGREAPVTIGRVPGSTILLNDPGVSSNHASIAYDGGRYYVQDLGARNGVFVNNNKISRQHLVSGDLIVVGTTRILVNLR
jgi:serine/threonine-protein kinase